MEVLTHTELAILIFSIVALIVASVQMVSAYLFLQKARRLVAEAREEIQQSSRPASAYQEHRDDYENGAWR